MSEPATRDLRPLFDPRSVAVVGASNDPAKWGHWLARGALRGRASSQACYLVNRSGGEVLGRTAYRSLAELPAEAELVAVAVPAAAFEETVDAVARGGSPGDRRDQRRAGGERRRRPGARAGGRRSGSGRRAPSCSGRTATGSSTPRADLHLGLDGLATGPIGLISQSGNLCYEIALLAADVGLGVSRVASVGNQADLEAADLIAAYADDPNTRVIAAYVEDFRDGRAFARAARASETPVVLLAAGQSDAGGGLRGRTRARSSATSPRWTRPAVRPGSSASRRRASWSTRRSSCSPGPPARAAARGRGRRRRHRRDRGGCGGRRRSRAADALGRAAGAARRRPAPDVGDGQPGRPRRCRRAGLRLLRTRDRRDSRVGRGRHGGAHGLPGRLRRPGRTRSRRASSRWPGRWPPPRRRAAVRSSVT